MLHTSDLHFGWRTALHSLAETVSQHLGDDETRPADSTLDDADDEREPFHLDDTELANRLVRERGLIHYVTPPHAHLLFPLAVQP